MGHTILYGKEVNHRFGGLHALVNVDFEIPQGVVYSIIGPNGAGKTTLFNVISGIQQGFSGQILFCDETICGLPPHLISLKGLTRTFQNVRLFKNLTVLENVMVGCHGWIAPTFFRAMFCTRATEKEEKQCRQRAMEVLSFTGLHQKADLEVDSLPMGEQKLLEIARALAAKPRLLLLDEPGGGLNDAEMVKLKELIFKIQKMGVTQVIVEHNMHFVMSISDRIMVLNFGVRIAEGSPRELVSNDEVIEVYLGKEVAGARTSQC